MATQNLGVVVSLPGAVDHSANQFKFGIINSSGEVALCGDGAAADGVIQNDPAAQGRAVALALPNCFSKIELGATLAAGAEVACDAAGVAVAPASNDRILGKLVQGGISGEVVTLHHYIGPIAP